MMTIQHTLPNVQFGELYVWSCLPLFTFIWIDTHLPVCSNDVRIIFSFLLYCYSRWWFQRGSLVSSYEQQTKIDFT
jgi:hypothetical protein